MKHNILYYLVNLEKTIESLKLKVSDKYTIEKQWLNIRGYELDWNNLKTLTEKMQWLKLHDHNPLYTTFVDKVKVKEWLKIHFGNSAIIPTYGVYKSANEIDFSILPNSFVLKCNHDSGSVYICYEKQSGIIYDKHMQPLDFETVKKQLNKALEYNFYYRHREWAYKKVQPRILCEQLLRCQNGAIPNDYKLFYINGEFQFVYLSYARETVNDRCTFDKDWKRLPFVWVEKDVYKNGINTSSVECPNSLDTMIEYGEKIAKYFKFVRVDFYDVDGEMYFGEITPFHSAGFAQFFPEKYDYVYGDKLNLK